MMQAVLKEAPPARRMPSASAVAFSCMLVVTVGALTWTVEFLSNPGALPIRRVQLEGEFIHIDPTRLQTVIEAGVDAGFFSLDVARVRAKLLDEPWIKDADVRRIWPDTLHVGVVEQLPVARWGAQALLNQDGDVFAPPVEELPANLARLDGPLGTETEVLSVFRGLSQRLREQNLQVLEVHLSARHAWTVVLAGSKRIVLGRTATQARLQRFLFAYERGLKDQWARIGQVDLRYPNGLAVSELPAFSESS